MKNHEFGHIFRTILFTRKSYLKVWLKQYRVFCCFLLIQNTTPSLYFNITKTPRKSNQILLKYKIYFKRVILSTSGNNNNNNNLSKVLQHFMIYSPLENYLSFIIIIICFTANFVHVCKRTDPQLEKCLVQTVESLRPEMTKGKFK